MNPSRTARHPHLGLGLLVLVLAAAGCGGTGRAAVQGKVTYNGEPVDNGTITFVPTAGPPESRGSGDVVDGKYTIDNTRGPFPGKYKVEILWNKKTGRKIGTPGDEGVKMDETRQMLPPTFNTNTKLTADVTSGSNTIDFEMKGDKLK